MQGSRWERTARAGKAERQRWEAKPDPGVSASTLFHASTARAAASLQTLGVGHERRRTSVLARRTGSVSTGQGTSAPGAHEHTNMPERGSLRTEDGDDGVKG